MKKKRDGEMQVRRVLGAVVAGVALACSGMSAHASDLLTGGYGGSDARPSRDAPDGPILREVESGPALVLDFTPRGGGGLIADDGGGADLPSLRFDLTVQATADDRIDRLGLGAAAEPSWLARDDEGPLGLIVGGAAHWDDLRLGAGYARAELFGTSTDMMAATFGYGALSGTLAYGQAEPSGDRDLDVLMLSTDLAASRWLTFESDVALGSSATERENMAVGRLGIRLNF